MGIQIVLQAVAAIIWPLVILGVVGVFYEQIRTLITSLSNSLQVSRIKIGALELSRKDVEETVDDLLKDLNATVEEMSTEQRSSKNAVPGVELPPTAGSDRGKLAGLKVVIRREVGGVGTDRQKVVAPTSYGRLTFKFWDRVQSRSIDRRR